MQKKELYQISEAAEILNVSVGFLRNLIATEKLPGVVRLSRVVRIRRDALDAMILNGLPK